MFRQGHFHDEGQKLSVLLQETKFIVTSSYQYDESWQYSNKCVKVIAYVKYGFLIFQKVSSRVLTFHVQWYPSIKAPLANSHLVMQQNLLCNVIIPLTKGQPFYVATFLVHLGWPYKRGTTVFVL